MSYNTFEIIYQILIFALLILGSISFMLFIRRMLINTSRQKHNFISIEKKLDKIIDHLEKDKNN